nr:glucose 1-dehydrogenase 2-like [Rhipicephalus microplus]
MGTPCAHLDEPFTISDVRRALHELNGRSAPGPDKVTNKALRNLEDDSVEFLTDEINRIWKGGDIPEQWKLAKVILIPKPVPTLSAYRLSRLGVCNASSCWFVNSGTSEMPIRRPDQDACARGCNTSTVCVIPGDISKENDVANVVEATVKHFGKIDILINNAGLFMEGTTDTATLDQFDNLWNVNVRGTLCMMRNALPHLRRCKGTIVNISSVASTVTVRNLTAYSITKAALDKLTRMTAFENASYGVRVNAINPGVIKTTFGMNPENNVQEHLKSLEEMAGGAHALGRIGRPEEVARCIAFLASEEASFVTGITMPVDGGLSLLSTFTGPNPWHK